MDRPARRIADEIAQRIADGDLIPGDRVPSTREIVRHYGVAMATATKVIADLRERGLVRTAPGIGTMVTPGVTVEGTTTTDRARVVRAAIAIADTEGPAGLTMRRLAGQLGRPTMSIYRHVRDKEELLLLMIDEVMGANPPPRLSPARNGWRACLEALCRLQWMMYRRHIWLAPAISFTRPLLAPNAMAHTEWAMRALADRGLSTDVRFRLAVMLANHVRGTAIGLEEEARAEQDTGMSDHDWFEAQHARLTAVLAGGRLPLMAGFIAGNTDFSLEMLMEFGLQRLLDGLAAMLPTSAP